MIIQVRKRNDGKIELSDSRAKVSSTGALVLTKEQALTLADALLAAVKEPD